MPMSVKVAVILWQSWSFPFTTTVNDPMPKLLIVGMLISPLVDVTVTPPVEPLKLVSEYVNTGAVADEIIDALKGVIVNVLVDC